MAYIGNIPAESYSAFQKQDFTTSATTSYTLDHPVANQNELALFINFVRQEPTAAYTASGTSLTLTSATSVGDDMYAIFLGKAIQTVNPPSGSVGLSQLSATGTKSSSTFLRGDNTFAEAGGGVDGIVSSANATAITIDSSENVSMSQNVSFNSGFGSATTVYGVRAWVNFDGTGTLAIQASGGVSSVTDNSVGSYTINFSTDMPDANFVAVNGSGYVESTSAQQWYRLGMNIPDDLDHHDVTARKVDNDAASFVSADIQRAQIAYIR